MIIELYQIFKSENGVFARCVLDDMSDSECEVYFSEDGFRLYGSQRAHSYSRPADIWISDVHEEIQRQWCVNDRTVTKDVCRLMKKGLISRDWRLWTEEEKVLLQLLLKC